MLEVRRFDVRDHPPLESADESGLEPGDIRVIALPDSIVLQAEPKSHEAKLFQRFSFSKSIDVDKVTARIEKNVLEVTAPKASGKAMAA